MPCRDEWAEEDRKLAYQEMANLEAWLCGVLTQLEKVANAKNPDPAKAAKDFGTFVANLDWAEIGTIDGANGLLQWWEKHKIADAARRQSEQVSSAKKNLAAQALQKLTPEERKALGL